jgi:hypothetical protein
MSGGVNPTRDPKGGLPLGGRVDPIPSPPEAPPEAPTPPPAGAQAVPKDGSTPGLHQLAQAAAPSFSDPMTGFMPPAAPGTEGGRSPASPGGGPSPQAGLAERVVTEGGSYAATAAEQGSKGALAAQRAGQSAEALRRATGDGLLGKAAEPLTRAMESTADLASKLPPSVAAASRVLVRGAPVISGVAASFDTARAMVEPASSPQKAMLEGQAAVSITSAVAGGVAVAGGAVVAVAGGTAAAVVAAPVAVAATVGAVALGVGSVVDNWAFGGRGQAWLGRTLRQATGRPLLFGK